MHPITQITPADQAEAIAAMLPIVREKQLDRMVAERADVLARLAEHDAARATEAAQLLADVLAARAKLAELKPAYEAAVRDLAKVERAEYLAGTVAENLRGRLLSGLAATLPDAWHALRRDLAFDLRMLDARVETKLTEGDAYRPARLEISGKREVDAGRAELQALVAEMDAAEALADFDPYTLAEDIEARRQAILRPLPGLPGGYAC